MWIDVDRSWVGPAFIALRLEQLGREAQRKALEWDELAYGRRLLGILCP